MLAQIQNDMKQALKSGDKFRLSTLRLLVSSIKNEAIEKRTELSEEEVLTVVQREVKQRRNAIEEYQKGNRDDLVKQAEDEIAILEVYLPQQLSDEELESLVKQVIEEQNVTSMKEMGKVMGKLMPQVKGRADGNRVQAMVKKILA
ncbi:GatB/YqeY domain-containing protein [Dethiobacter alkaliphilus]|uniref:GatB/YqeY n=1 Tax=Dethiobacter alkaliphilus AHT 1 TaxID=555088 RepID=C0GHM9_DETAL|nr:GatB/YqeY domain-containing protein [Dethiobacter alkaliphilus]EEG77235.1 GatB/YqeY [Dethiobacter alkaliphilus AHT 1]MCW3489955.1 GatB/YqeY domain-containing protein [Dethiobacter alkaliphilus]